MKKMNTAQILKSVYSKLERNVNGGENAGYQHFLGFPRCFYMPSRYKLCGRKIMLCLCKLPSHCPLNLYSVDLTVKRKLKLKCYLLCMVCTL